MVTHFEQGALAGGRLRFRPFRDDVPVTFEGFYQLLEHDVEFRSEFTALLAGLPFDAIQWETPPTSARTLEGDFEFVVIESVALGNVAPTPEPFSGFFEREDDQN